MGTDIKTWQILDGKLDLLETSLMQADRTEPYDLEPWLASYPAILGEDIIIIGRQVISRSGPLDLLGIDKTGNVVIIEIKRDKLPREALTQAIDYASDVAEWTIDRLSEICSQYSGQSLEETLTDKFPDIDLETININNTQRIILVGFSVEPALERMIEWLSDSFGININAVILKYIKTKGGDELLTKTSIISEERVQNPRTFQIPMSDEPGTHEPEVLKNKLLGYLNDKKVTNQRIKDVLLPALFQKNILTRKQLKKDLLKYDPTLDPSKVGYHLTVMSSQLGMRKNDFLRQIIKYEYPTYTWEKDNFSLREEHKNLVQIVLNEINKNEGVCKDI